MHVRPQLCERSRFWVSLRVDGELSQLESALLSAHLERCPSCRAFARGVEEVARGLRRARLERPAAFVLPAPRRHSTARAVQFAAAAAAVVAAGAIAALTGPGSAPTAVKPVAMVAAVESPDRLRELRRPTLILQGRQAAAPPRSRRLLAEPV